MPFICKECKRNFPRAMELNVHLSVVHGQRGLFICGKFEPNSKLATTPHRVLGHFCTSYLTVNKSRKCFVVFSSSFTNSDKWNRYGMSSGRLDI